MSDDPNVMWDSSSDKLSSGKMRGRSGGYDWSFLIRWSRITKQTIDVLVFLFLSFCERSMKVVLLEIVLECLHFFSELQITVWKADLVPCKLGLVVSKAHNTFPCLVSLPVPRLEKKSKKKSFLHWNEFEVSTSLVKVSPGFLDAFIY
jgi:hypothetical protein